MIFFESLCMLKSEISIQVKIVSLKGKLYVFHLCDALDSLRDALGLCDTLGDCSQCNLTPARRTGQPARRTG